MKRVAAAGAMIVVAMLGWVGHGTTVMNEKLDVLAARPPQKEADVPSVATTWKSANGTHTVTTQQLAGETNSAWAQRHKAAVDAMLIIYPKA